MTFCWRPTPPPISSSSPSLSLVGWGPLSHSSIVLAGRIGRKVDLGGRELLKISYLFQPLFCLFLSRPFLELFIPFVRTQDKNSVSQWPPPLQTAGPSALPISLVSLGKHPHKADLLKETFLANLVP